MSFVGAEVQTYHKSHITNDSNLFTAINEKAAVTIIAPSSKLDDDSKQICCSMSHVNGDFIHNILNESTNDNSLDITQLNHNSSILDLDLSSQRSVISNPTLPVDAVNTYHTEFPLNSFQNNSKNFYSSIPHPYIGDNSNFGPIYHRNHFYYRHSYNRPYDKVKLPENMSQNVHNTNLPLSNTSPSHVNAYSLSGYQSFYNPSHQII